MENHILHGDVLIKMQEIKEADMKVNCIITSPPYWKLRDYGYSEQWGLEPTYQEYLEHLWQFMDLAYDILTEDGTVWVNLGDTYAKVGVAKKKHRNGKIEGIASKCLLLIPHRFAIGCIDRGWIMRNDIIWAKRNGMTEGVTDRFTKKHEYIFFMAKSQKYYFDLDAVRDKHKWAHKDKRADGKRHKSKGLSESGNYATNVVCFNQKGKNPGDVSDFWDVPTKANSSNHYATYNTKLIDKAILAGCPKGGIILDPFCGTGTTCIRSIQLGRNTIGIDGSSEYVKTARESLEIEKSQQKLFP